MYKAYSTVFSGQESFTVINLCKEVDEVHLNIKV